MNNFYSTEMRNGNENKTNLYRFVSEIPTVWAHMDYFILLNQSLYFSAIVVVVAISHGR